MLNNLLFSTRFHYCYLLDEGSHYEKEGANYEEDDRYNEARHETRQEHEYAEGNGHRTYHYLSPRQSSNNGGNSNRDLRGSLHYMQFLQK